MTIILKKDIIILIDQTNKLIRQKHWQTTEREKDIKLNYDESLESEINIEN